MSRYGSRRPHRHTRRWIQNAAPNRCIEATAQFSASVRIKRGVLILREPRDATYSLSAPVSLVTFHIHSLHIFDPCTARLPFDLVGSESVCACVGQRPLIWNSIP